MLKKICILLLLLIVCLPFCFGIDFGFVSTGYLSFHEDMIENYEFQGSFYFGKTWLTQIGKFIVHPALIVRDKNVYINFDEVSADFFIGKHLLEIGKYYVFFGHGVIYNTLFPEVPFFVGINTKFWNAKYSYSNKNFDIKAGFIIDTDMLDQYKTPKWYNAYFVSRLQNEVFDISCEVDYAILLDDVIITNNFLKNYRNDLNDGDLKFSFDTSYLGKKDTSLYGGVSYYFNVKQDVNAISNLFGYIGLSKPFIISNECTLFCCTEVAYAKEKIEGILAVSFECSSFLHFMCSVELGEKKVNLQVELDTYIDEIEINVKYRSINMAVENSLMNKPNLYLGLKIENL